MDAAAHIERIGKDGYTIIENAIEPDLVDALNDDLLRLEKKLGTKFDVRKFHDAVLENGAVPLSVLQARMKRWMGEQAGR